MQGNGTALVNNYASVPTFVDVIAPGASAATTVVQQTFAMPTVQLGNQMACTLTASQVRG
jgi:hypothetical protein